MSPAALAAAVEGLEAQLRGASDWLIQAGLNTERARELLDTAETAEQAASEQVTALREALDELRQLESLEHAEMVDGFISEAAEQYAAGVDRELDR